MSGKPQAVLLAAGKSTRTYPLTLTKPKPLLPVANKPIMAHNLDQLIGMVDEAIIIVGYKQEMIRDYFGDTYRGIKLRFVEQSEQLGSGHAISLAEPYIKDVFVMMVVMTCVPGLILKPH
jgi:NDP-sugar pyrophosphorylase family protein